MSKIFVSIATYNEKENIEKLIRDIFALGLFDFSVIITDDNSPDGTADIVADLQKEFPSLFLISRSGKLGYGSAHIAGFKKAMTSGAEIIISMDADFSHNPKVIPEMIKAIEAGNDVAIGSRRVPGGEVIGWNLWRKFCSAGAMLTSQIVLGIKTHDLTSGYRAYHRRVFEKLNLDDIRSDGYSFLEEFIYLVEKSGFKIKEIPIVFYDRRLGHSKLSRKEILKFFSTILKIKFGRDKKIIRHGKRLLMITRKVDKNDALAGFAYNWVRKIGENCEKLYVISWQKGNRGDLPENVEVGFLPDNLWLKILFFEFNLLRILPKISGIFCHMNPEYTILAAWPAKLFGKKIVSWYTHKTITWRRRWMEFLADTILTASPESFREPRYPKKVKAVGHGIDLGIFNNSNQQLNSDGICHLCTIGRISPTKDYESIIKAVEILKSEKIDLKIIGGIGLKSQEEYSNDLKSIVELLKISDQIDFVGEVPNQEIRNYLWLADIFINLSDTGSLDKAVLESMACGCLVLTSNEAFKNVLPSELMVEKNNPAKLAEKIKWLMNLPDSEKEAIRKKIINEVKEHHNLDNLARIIVEQFK